jgi:hypothetical protein
MSDELFIHRFNAVISISKNIKLKNNEDYQ